MIKIVTDSASDIPKKITEELNIYILPIIITTEDKTIKEFFDITPAEYYDILTNCKEIPKTAQVTLLDFEKCFKKAKDQGVTELLYISINGNGSGTYSTSLIARDMFYEDHGTSMKIEIIDSATYSYIYGDTVVQCAKKVLDGCSFDEIISFAKENLKTAVGYLGVSELKFLKKSGRISGGSAFVGEAIGLKPISRIADGAVTVCDKGRGDKGLCKKIIENIKKDCKNQAEQTAYIMHGICSQDILNSLKTSLIDDIGFKNVEFLDVGASIVTNTGPKSFIVYYHN